MELSDEAIPDTSQLFVGYAKLSIVCRFQAAMNVSCIPENDHQMTFRSDINTC